MEIIKRIRKIGEVGARVGATVLVVGALKGPVGPVRAEKVSPAEESESKIEMPLARQIDKNEAVLPIVEEKSERDEETVVSGATFTTADGRTYGVGPSGQFLVDSPVETESVVSDSVSDNHEGQFSVTTDGVKRCYGVGPSGQFLVSEEPE